MVRLFRIIGSSDPEWNDGQWGGAGPHVPPLPWNEHTACGPAPLEPMLLAVAYRPFTNRKDGAPHYTGDVGAIKNPGHQTKRLHDIPGMICG